MSGAQQPVYPWVFSSIHPWPISLARGAPSSSAPFTPYPCLQATSLCYINSLTCGMQIVVFDTSGFCALLCACLNAGETHAGDTASGLLAEQIWSYFGVCFGVLLNQHLCDPQLGVSKVRTQWPGLHCSWKMVWELPSVCLPAGLLADNLYEWTWQTTRQLGARALSTWMP